MGIDLSDLIQQGHQVLNDLAALLHLGPGPGNGPLHLRQASSFDGSIEKGELSNHMNRRPLGGTPGTIESLGVAV